MTDSAISLTPAQLLVSTARNPIPNGAKPGKFEGRDGIKLRYALWGTTAKQRFGTVALFGGRGEFIEKYFETITDLRRRGFAVATMDWRGQGGSDRLLSNPFKGHVEDFAHHDDDLERFMDRIVLPDCPPPFYGLAHSMGGNIVLRSAQSKVCWFDRLILAAPMIGLAEKRIGAPVIRGVAEAATLLGLGDFFIPGGRAKAWEHEPFEGNQLTSDRLRYDRARDVLQVAPFLGIGSPTVGWVAAACNSINHINSFAFQQSVEAPVLIIAAGNDQVVSARAIETFASRIRNCTRVVIAGAKHEILQERDELRDQFWAAFDAYIPGSARATSEAALGL